MLFTDSYGEQSCTAGRASFITGQGVFRTGLSKVGVPGAAVGLQAEDPTVAELLKPLGYATGQFGKNHLGGPHSRRAADYWEHHVTGVAGVVKDLLGGRPQVGVRVDGNGPAGYSDSAPIRGSRWTG
jgi:arylsulfatase A-like enzyme